MTASSAKPVIRKLDLALQGGGSHGAFTWGVLDRLLEEEDIEFSGISGTSAGAVNSAVLVTGLVHGGREGARKALHDFWRDVSVSGLIFSPFSLTQASAGANGHVNFDQLPSYQWLNAFWRTFSPYEFNPLNLNPLRDVVLRHVDIDALHRCHEKRPGLRLFIAATSVHTGQARLFTGKDVSIEALLASACLPFIFQAVEIDGEPYWDGGYSGNPAIFPLIYHSEALDIMLVKINPLMREGTPTRSVDIIDRLSEITFNTSLLAEMRAIAFVSRLLREQRLDAGRYKDLRMHMIADDEGLAPFNASSKFNTDWGFLQQLSGLGREAADRWLKQHRAAIGQHATLDMEREFLRKPWGNASRRPAHAEADPAVELPADLTDTATATHAAGKPAAKPEPAREPAHTRKAVSPAPATQAAVQRQPRTKRLLKSLRRLWGAS